MVYICNCFSHGWILLGAAQVDLMTELSTEIVRLYWSLSINGITFSFPNFITGLVILNFMTLPGCLFLKSNFIFFCTASRMRQISDSYIQSYLKPFICSSSRTCLYHSVFLFWSFGDRNITRSTWHFLKRMTRRPEKEDFCLFVWWLVCFVLFNNLCSSVFHAGEGYCSFFSMFQYLKKARQGVAGLPYQNWASEKQHQWDVMM